MKLLVGGIQCSGWRSCEVNSRWDAVAIAQFAFRDGRSDCHAQFHFPQARTCPWLLLVRLSFQRSWHAVSNPVYGVQRTVLHSRDPAKPFTGCMIDHSVSFLHRIRFIAKLQNCCSAYSILWLMAGASRSYGSSCPERESQQKHFTRPEKQPLAWER